MWAFKLVITYKQKSLVHWNSLLHMLKLGKVVPVQCPGAMRDRYFLYPVVDSEGPHLGCNLEDWSQRTRVKWIPPVLLQTQQDSKSDRETTLGGSRIPCVHCLRPWGCRKQVCQQCHLTTQWSHFNTKLFYRTAVRRSFVPTQKEILPNTVKVRFSHVKKWTIYTRQKIHNILT